MKRLIAGVLMIAAAATAEAWWASSSGAAPNATRARIDLTHMVRTTRTIPLALVTPAMAQNIGPGSHLLIEIPGAGTFGCTANFIWANGAVRYLGAAGHCFIPEG